MTAEDMLNLNVWWYAARYRPGVYKIGYGPRWGRSTVTPIGVLPL